MSGYGKSLCVVFLLSGCFPFPIENPSHSSRKGDPVFGYFQAGASWEYEIFWIRNGACIGDRIRTIKLEKTLPRAGSTLLIYHWRDVKKVPDSTKDNWVDCDTVNAEFRYDSVLLDSNSRFEFHESVTDELDYGDLRRMSFFQIKRIPSDTDSTTLCDSVKSALAGRRREQGRELVEIIDTIACLNGFGGRVSFSRYLQNVGLLKKRWGYTDQGVVIDNTTITLLKFNGRAIAAE